MRAGDIPSRHLTWSAMSSGRIMSSAATWPSTNAVVAVPVRHRPCVKSGLGSPGRRRARQSDRLPSLRMSPRAVTLLLPATLSLALAACGSSSDSTSSTASTPSPSSASVKPQDFPKSSGLTFQDVQSRYPAQLAVAIGASVMRQGENRLPFLVLDKGARPVRNAPVALYTMRNDGTHVRGPYLAKERPFGIKPAYLSRTTASDPDQAKAFYTADVKFSGKPPQAIFGLVRQDGRLVATSPSPLGVKLDKAPPDVGDKAPLIHTQTTGDETDLSKITTREPPDKDLLTTDFADVLGKKPIVLVFATPALCQSRVCGPDVDVAEQVKAETGDRAVFIHQEIYRDNQVNKGLRPQLATYRLQSEPWIFVIDRNGVISSRIEGAVSVDELRAAVQKVV